MDKPPHATRALAIISLIVAVLAAFALCFAYWLTSSTQVLGGLLALALFAAGAGLTLWGRGYMQHEIVEGEREPLASSEEEWNELTRDIQTGADTIGRRRFLVGALCAFAGALGIAGISFLRSLAPHVPAKVLWHTPWKHGVRLVKLDGMPIKADELPVDSFAVVFPEGHIDNLSGATNLVRVKEDLLDLPSDQKSWAVKGIVAYSRICTHAGCPVAQYEDSKHVFSCPCHQSIFNVLNGAVPIGGPATRPLPQLPLGVDSAGYLIATSDFKSPVGPGFWSIK